MLGALLLTVMLVGLAPGSARAEEGTPVGWALDDASQTLIKGRALFRYEPGLEDETRELADNLPQWWSEIERVLGSDLDDSVIIHVVSHSGMVAHATDMPVWVSGVAHPPRGEIAIAIHDPDGSRSDLDTLLRHELVHVALFRASEGAELPRWFHEGVAESIANEVDLLRAEALASAVFGVGVPPIGELEASFHGDAKQASVAYAASRDFATWLRYHDADGSQFRQLFSQLRMGRGFETAVADAYGESLGELDEQWRAGLLGRFMWFPLLGSGELPFLLLGPVIGYAWVRRRRQLAAGWARLEAEDEAERSHRLDVGMALRA
ncbi:peptidase MA family metallohydrolase [Nannocystaceae bacterium ST9]